jgi:RNA polymerase sigma-70 factor (ECF subfamily)
MRDAMTFDARGLDDSLVEADAPAAMTEEEFRAFYERTARPLRAYLSRLVGNGPLADDLLQEAYYRLVRSAPRLSTEAHSRHYLFRIATNLARDHHRHRQPGVVSLGDHEHPAPEGEGGLAGRTARRTDLARAMARLTARQRALVWLAYAEGATHQEIGTVLGVRTGSVKLMLFRARRKLASLLGDTRPEREGFRRAEPPQENTDAC